MDKLITASKAAFFCNIGIVVFCVISFIYLKEVGGFPWIMILPAVYSGVSAGVNYKAVKRLGGSLWKSAK